MLDCREADLARFERDWLVVRSIAFCVVFFGTQHTVHAKYTPQIHASQMRKAVVNSQFGCAGGCLKLIAGVQELADDRSSDGDKSDGRFYLHFVWPKRGYSLAAHRQVLATLGLLESGVRTKASLDEFVRAAEERAQLAIASMVRDSGGELGNKAAGQILYIIGTLVHAYQDRKHMEGNWTRGSGAGITVLDHHALEIHQWYTDYWPSDASQKRSVRRTRQLLIRFYDTIVTADPSGGALARLEKFELKAKVAVYRPAPDVMNLVFPVYGTDNHTYEGNLAMRAGVVFQESTAANIELGWKVHLFFGSGPRVELGLYGGVELGSTSIGYGKFTALTGFYDGYISAGVGIIKQVALDTRDPIAGQILIVPTISVLNDLVSFEAQRVSISGQKRWRFVTLLNIWSAARLTGLVSETL